MKIHISSSSSFSKNFKQITAGIISLSPYLINGINQGFSSNILPLQEAHSFSFRIDEFDLSWIASLTIICMPFGSFCAGPLMNRFGRKKTLLVLCLLIIIGWIFVLLANSVLMMCIGRCVIGFASGMQIAASLYIVEIMATPEWRAIMLSIINPAIGLGIAISFVVGASLSAQSYSIVICALTLLLLGLTSVIPESPVWLLLRGDEAAAAAALKWLRRDDENVDDLRREIGDDVDSKAEQPKSSLRSRIMVTKAWKPFLHLTLLFMLQDLSGYIILVFYATNFQQMFDVPLSSSTSAIIEGTLQFLAWTFLSCVVNKLSRRTWMLISAVGAFACYAVAGLYVYYDAYASADNTRPLIWLPWACVQTSVVFSCLGISSLPWMMVGELFPATVRDFMSSFQLTTVYVIEFVIIKLYPLMQPYLQLLGTLAIFGACSFLAILYSLFLLPETRGKTLAEIEKSWLR